MIPNARRLKQNLPKGVMNVVMSEDGGSSFTCHNLSWHQDFDPPSWASDCSTEGRMCCTPVGRLEIILFFHPFVLP